MKNDKNEGEQKNEKATVDRKITEEMKRIEPYLLPPPYAASPPVKQLAGKRRTKTAVRSERTTQLKKGGKSLKKRKTTPLAADAAMRRRKLAWPASTQGREEGGRMGVREERQRERECSNEEGEGPKF